MRLNLPGEEEQAAADSRTMKAILTKRNGKTSASTSTSGNNVLPENLLVAAGAGDPLPLPAPALDMVSLFIPVVDM